MKLALSLIALTAPLIAMGDATFNVVWKEVATVSSNAPGHAPTIRTTTARTTQSRGSSARVNRVSVQPESVVVKVGQRVCVSRLDIATYGPDGERTAAIPLSLHLQAEHLQQLALIHASNDLCLRPTSAGEYILRFSSMIPASDDTLRGAQMFIRAH